MNKIYCIFFIFIPQFILAQQNFLKPVDDQTWRFIGNSTIPIAQGGVPSIAVDVNNVPYIAFDDYSYSNSISIMRYNGTNWEYVGQPGISSNQVYSPSLTIDNSGVPYVAYVDDSLADGKVVVKKFDGTNWIPVGPFGISPSYANNPTILFDNNGVLYLSYSDRTIFKWNVMKYSSSGWVFVGPSNFTPMSFGSSFLSISSSGEIFLCFIESSTSQDIIKLMKFDGTNWNNFGQYGPQLYTSLSPFYMAIGPDGFPYVLYQTYVTQKLSVIRNDGNSWTDIGDTVFSSNLVNYAILSFDPSGVPFVACDDSSYANVYSLQGNTWSHVGFSDFSGTTTNGLNFCISPSGVPYTAYITNTAPYGIFEKQYNYPQGINSVKSEKLTVFPNPALDKISITFSKGNNLDKQIDIYTSTGSLLQELTTHNNRIIIKISEYPTGMYYIKVMTQNTVSSGKFCKL